jgi:hypothetical protein
MESTGVYWKPVWNVPEGQFNLPLVNAQHGRKTDVRIASALQNCFSSDHFVPVSCQRLGFVTCVT